MRKQPEMDSQGFKERTHKAVRKKWGWDMGEVWKGRGWGWSSSKHIRRAHEILQRTEMEEKIDGVLVLVKSVYVFI